MGDLGKNTKTTVFLIVNQVKNYNRAEAQKHYHNKILHAFAPARHGNLLLYRECGLINPKITCNYHCN